MSSFIAYAKADHSVCKHMLQHFHVSPNPRACISLSFRKGAKTFSSFQKKQTHFFHSSFVPPTKEKSEKQLLFGFSNATQEPFLLHQEDRALFIITIFLPCNQQHYGNNYVGSQWSTTISHLLLFFLGPITSRLYGVFYFLFFNQELPEIRLRFGLHEQG